MAFYLKYLSLKGEVSRFYNLLEQLHIFHVSELEENESDDENVKHSQSANKTGKKTSRAQSLQELQQRLQALTANKKRLTYKEKLEKKGIKNRMKKKNHQDERNAQKKLARATKLENITKDKVEGDSAEKSNERPSIKPIFNKGDKMVFSKIDFANLGKTKKIKKEKDPRKLLKKIEVQKEKIEKLKEEGKIEIAIQIKEKTAWQNALAKVEGQKVKDDPMLLKKSLKKKTQKKQSSKKKWEQRIKNVEKAKEEKQQKRMANIQKKKKEKKTKKNKRAVQKGKVIPGY